MNQVVTASVAAYRLPIATAAQSDIPVPATQLLQQCGGRPVLLYEEGKAVAAIVSMEDYEIVHREKMARLLQACEAMAREAELNGGIDDATFAELTAD